MELSNYGMCKVSHLMKLLFTRNRFIQLLKFGHNYLLVVENWDKSRVMTIVFLKLQLLLTELKIAAILF